MRKLLALALTGLFLAFAGMSGGSQAAPAGAAADVLRIVKDTTAKQTETVRHRRWNRRCRLVYSCYRNPWGKKRCSYVRRCGW